MTRKVKSRGWTRREHDYRVKPVLLILSLLPIQEASSQAQTIEEDVYVIGVKKSLEKSSTIKYSAEQLVDAVVAEDIGKRPDDNVSKAMQRITGVQINRNEEQGYPI